MRNSVLNMLNSSKIYRGEIPLFTYSTNKSNMHNFGGRENDIRMDYIYKLRFTMICDNSIHELQVSVNIFNMSKERMKELYADMAYNMWKSSYMALVPDEPLYEEQVF